MVRSEAEYQTAIKRLNEHRDFAVRQKAELEEEGYSPDEVARGMAPLLAFQAQIAEDIAWYERVSRGHIDPMETLFGFGRLLIALRIARGWTQHDLAMKLGVKDSVVSRDEHNEYHGITLERAQRILDIFGAKVRTTVEETNRGEISLPVPN
jgi:DNA-binding XRE family transcriptional regulator